MPLTFQDIYDCDLKLQSMHDVRAPNSRIKRLTGTLCAPIVKQLRVALAAKANMA